MKSNLSALTLAFTICVSLSYVHCVGVFGPDTDEAADSEDSLRRKKRDAGSGQGGAADSAAQIPTSSPSPSGTTTNCWPYDRPSMATLRASKHKAFVHYFAPFPISIDNEPPAQDYYEKHYLNPHGEGDKFIGQGGFLRERPVPQSPWPSGIDVVEKNMEIEVRRRSVSTVSCSTSSTPTQAASCVAFWMRSISPRKRSIPTSGSCSSWT